MPEPEPLPSIRTPWGDLMPPPGSTGDGLEPPPVSVPDHVLLRRIGRGSYGEVWLAKNVLGLFRAVKVLHRSAFGDDRPFEREFGGIQRFEPVSRSHESQLNILHVGRTADHFYYVMELADDQGHGAVVDEFTYTPRTLRSELLFRGRLPVDECIRLGLALTTALGHLHRHGLVHRDIKPSNIVFVNGIPKLADIGLVAPAERTMSFVGTEGYLPPEGPGTVQADLFSLGKVLYEISTGNDRQQFPELPTNIMELPDQAALAEFNEVLVRACAPEVKLRYQTAAEIHADLALLQSGGSVSRQRRLAGQLRLVQRAGAILAGLATVIALGWWWQARQTQTVRSLSAEKSRLAEENRERLVRLNVANGVREMEDGELASSLVWLTEALVLTTNNPADAAVQRIRIHHLLASHPRLLRLWAHPGAVSSVDFSPDESRVVTACADGVVRVWNVAEDDGPGVVTSPFSGPTSHARFTADGARLFVVQGDSRSLPVRAALLDAVSGQPLFPAIAGVTAVALSPDDRWLAVARTNVVVQLIAADTGRVVAEIVGHDVPVRWISFSPDSAQVLTAGGDHTVRRWSTATGQPIGPPLRHAQPVARAVFNSDASRIATATGTVGFGRAIQFQTWDTASGEPLGAPLPGDGSCELLAFDPGGHHLLTADGEGPVQVWDADSHAPIAPPLQAGSPARVVAFSPDGTLVAIGTDNGQVRVWNVETGRLELPPLHHAGRPLSLCFNRDGSRLLTSGDDGTVKVWDLALVPDDGRLAIRAFERARAVLSRDGRQLLLRVTDLPWTVRLVDLDPLGLVPSFLVPDVVHLESLTIDASGRQWAVAPSPSIYFEHQPPVAGLPSTAGLWRREGEQVQFFPLPHPDRVRGVFFHRDGHQLLTVGDDRMTRIWNTANGSLRQAIPWPPDDFAWVAVSPDLRVAVTLGRDARGGHFQLREVQTGKSPGPAAEEAAEINAAAFSPDGNRLATAGDDRCGRVWDTHTGRLASPVFRHGSPLTTVGWSPDGRRVLTAGRSPEVKVWDAVSGELALPPLTMKRQPVEGARFSADSRFVVARSEEKLVRVWDAATGEPVTPLLPHHDNVRDAFVTPARQLVTVSDPCVVRVWQLQQAPFDARELSGYARLLTGAALPPSRSMAAAGPSESATRLRSLRGRQPAWFAVSPERLADWHRLQTPEPHSLNQVRSALFHREQAARLAPEDPELAGQIRSLRADLIPVRDPAAPRPLLDLTRAYTHSFEMLRLQTFAELPRGCQTMNGTAFDLRGVIQLDHRSERAELVGPFHPSASVIVAQRCRHLHFLQATEGEPRIEGSTVARWIMHYADGSTQEWPVIYGEQVRDWWWLPDSEPLEARQARLVWRGRSPVWNASGTDGCRLFLSTWTNPQPAVLIRRLEYRIGETSLKPLVVAITAD